MLKQVSAHASETATEDQAADHTHQNKLQRTEFELNVTEDPPTGDQLRTILEYVGSSKANRIVEGAKDAEDAINKLKEDAKRFRAPVVRSIGKVCLWVCSADGDRLWTGTMGELVSGSVLGFEL